MHFERISDTPRVAGGKPSIRGLRVTPDTLLDLLGSCKSRERILEAYPDLESAGLDAALSYTAWRFEEREEALVVA